MANVRNSRKATRSVAGLSVAALGPSLILAFVFGLFPALNLMSLGVGYCACLNLNYTQLCEAESSTKAAAQSPRGPIKDLIPREWSASGLGLFVAKVSKPETTVTYYRPVGLDDEVVVVTTRVSVKPVVALPVFKDVPGLGAPFTYEFSSGRLLKYSVSS